MKLYKVQLNEEWQNAFRYIDPIIAKQIVFEYDNKEITVYHVLIGNGSISAGQCIPGNMLEILEEL